MFGFAFAPKGWAACNGQIIPVNQNPALFSLLTNAFGGDGRTTFALPDLRGRVPLACNPTYPIGNSGGVEAVTVTAGQLPGHNHTVAGTSSLATKNAAQVNGLLAAGATGGIAGAPANAYAAASSPVALDPNSLGSAGGSGAHSNVQPSLVVNFCIALTGLYPARP